MNRTNKEIHRKLLLRLTSIIVDKGLVPESIREKEDPLELAQAIVIALWLNNKELGIELIQPEGRRPVHVASFAFCKNVADAVVSVVTDSPLMTFGARDLFGFTEEVVRIIMLYLDEQEIDLVDLRA